MTERDTPKCGTCFYWHYRADVKAVANASGPIAANDLQGIGVGDCTGMPPEVHIVPIRTLQGDGIGPQSFDRQTLSIRPCCHIHQDAPINASVRLHMEKTDGYLNESETAVKAFAEAVPLVADVLPLSGGRYPGDKDSN